MATIWKNGHERLHINDEGTARGRQCQWLANWYQWQGVTADSISATRTRVQMRERQGVIESVVEGRKDERHKAAKAREDWEDRLWACHARVTVPYSTV